MGRNPDEIEREIASRRSQITNHIQDVQERVRDDVASVKQTASEQVSEAVDQTKTKLDFKGQTREHPYTMVAGALGLGVLLGAVSEGMPGGGKSGNHNGGNQDSGHSSSNNGSSSGMLGGLVTSMLGPTADTVRDELRELVKEGFSTFKQTSGINQDPRQAPAQTPPHT
jgi:ElaB/YqjD/DUF883 family membrane-anchored ribosome-binding protein